MSEEFKGMVRLTANEVIEKAFQRLVDHEDKHRADYKRELDKVVNELRSFSVFGWKPLKNITPEQAERRDEFRVTSCSMRWDDREVRRRLQVALDLANAANSDGGDGVVFLAHEIALEVCGRCFTLESRTEAR